MAAQTTPCTQEAFRRQEQSGPGRKGQGHRTVTCDAKMDRMGAGPVAQGESPYCEGPRAERGKELQKRGHV